MLTAEISIGVPGHPQHDLLGSVVVGLLHGKAKFPKCEPCMHGRIRNSRSCYDILYYPELIRGLALKSENHGNYSCVHNMYHVFILKLRSVPESQKTIEMVPGLDPGKPFRNLERTFRGTKPPFPMAISTFSGCTRRKV